MSEEMEYDKSRFKAWTWKHPLILHWILNPGLLINDLILGQRVPRLSLLERDRSKSLQERAFVPCPHCQALHPGIKWGLHQPTVFGNWFGLYCDQCGKVIPCLRNLGSLLILILSFPIWYWLKDSWKNAWLRKQPERYQSLSLEPAQNVYAGYGWLKQGLSFGLLLFVAMNLLYPWLSGSEIHIRSILIGIPVWVIGGLLFAYTMKRVLGKKQSGSQASPPSRG